MEYKIVRVGSRLGGDMERDVNEEIKNGWIPLGGVAIAAYEGEVVLLQAMTRDPTSRLTAARNQ